MNKIRKKVNLRKVTQTSLKSNMVGICLYIDDFYLAVDKESAILINS